MDINISKVNPTFVEHEGFYYLEFEGEFFKGCKRCGGEGHFSHNGDHSRCYDCDNTSAKLGEQLPSREAAEKWCHERAVRRAQRERKAEAEAQKTRDARDARVQAMKANDPEVYSLLTKIYEAENEAYATGDYSKVSKSGFLREMASNLFNAVGKDFTENMMVALRNTVAQLAERAAVDAARPAVVEGKQQITGTVLSTKIVDGDYGITYKMLVETEQGFKVFGTIPSSMLEQYTLAEFQGVRVQFSATVEASRDDKSFGFFKRPTKGIVL